MKFIKLFENFQEENYLREHILNNNFGKEFKKLIDKYKIQNLENYDRYSPPKKLEDEYHISGISTTYNIPFGLNEEQFENLSEIFMDDEEIMNILFDAMLKANPKLEIFRSLPFKSKEFMYPTGGVIGGACSKMNIDDIKDYIENKTEIVEYPKGYPNLGEYKLKRTNNEKEYNEFINRLYKKKINIHYFPSIKTMKKILNQI